MHKTYYYDLNAGIYMYYTRADKDRICLLPSALLCFLYRVFSLSDRLFVYLSVCQSVSVSRPVCPRVCAFE